MCCCVCAEAWFEGTEVKGERNGREGQPLGIKSTRGQRGRRSGTVCFLRCETGQCVSSTEGKVRLQGERDGRRCDALRGVKGAESRAHVQGCPGETVIGGKAKPRTSKCMGHRAGSLLEAGCGFLQAVQSTVGSYGD